MLRAAATLRLLLLIIPFFTVESFISLDKNWIVQNGNNDSIKMTDVALPIDVMTLVWQRLYSGLPSKHPAYGYNELLYKWVAFESWIFTTTFHCDHNDTSYKLVLENVDTIAHVSVNNKTVTTLQNAFITHNLNVSLNTGVNTVQIRILPSLEFAKQKAQEYIYNVSSTINYNTWSEPTNRAFIRKSAVSMGWDFAPAFISAGVSKVFLERVPVLAIGPFVKILQHHFRNSVILEFNVPIILASRTTTNSLLNVTVTSPNQNNNVVTKSVSVAVNSTTNVAFNMTIPNPILWWPVGHGNASLYEITIKLLVSSVVLDSRQMKIGLRTISVDRNTFQFTVNNREVFIKGANYVTTKNSVQHRRHLLQSILASNMNMIRIWGGSSYEENWFYSECDKLGILVWQELMFACSMYPSRSPEFIQNIESEVHYVTSKLSNHPSIALWGGNNEVESVMAQFQNISALRFNRDLFVIDYQALFIDTISPMMSIIDPQRVFIDTSPSNGVFTTTNTLIKQWGDVSDPSRGDIHYYNYTCDCEKSYIENPNFVSEFGYQSFPGLYTLKHFMNHSASFNLRNSSWMKFRQRHENGNEQMIDQVSRHFTWPSTTTDDEYQIYLTQVQQARCVEASVAAWRQSRRTNGILYWQLNDVWAGPSWSSIDVQGNWKVLHYVAKKFYSSSYISFTDNSFSLSVFLTREFNEIRGILRIWLYDSLSGDLVSNVLTVKVGKEEHQSYLTWSNRNETLKSYGCTRVSRCYLEAEFITGKTSVVAASQLHFFTTMNHYAIERREGMMMGGGVEILNVTSGERPSFLFKVCIEAKGYVAFYVTVEFDQNGAMPGFFDTNVIHALRPKNPVCLSYRLTDTTTTSRSTVPNLKDIRNALSIQFIKRQHQDSRVQAIF